MKKRWVSFLLALALAVGLVATTTTPANAAGGVEERLNIVRAEFPNDAYFTTDGNPNSSGELTDVLRAKGMSTSGYDQSWTCLAFAKYVWAKVFGHNVTEQRREVGAGAAGLSSTWDNALPGDCIYFYSDSALTDWGHAAIYLGKSGNNVYLVDCDYYHSNQIMYYTATIGGGMWPRAYCRVFRSTNYNEVDGSTVDIKAPATPTNFKAAWNVKGSSVNLSWNASDGATSYQAQYKRSGIDWTTDNDYKSGTSYTSTVGAFSEYQFRIRAVNAGGYSNWVSVTIKNIDDTIAPSAPTNLKATWNEGSLTANISWSASSGATSYEAQYSHGTGDWATDRDYKAGTSILNPTSRRCRNSSSPRREWLEQISTLA